MSQIVIHFEDARNYLGWTLDCCQFAISIISLANRCSSISFNNCHLSLSHWLLSLKRLLLSLFNLSQEPIYEIKCAIFDWNLIFKALRNRSDKLQSFSLWIVFFLEIIKAKVWFQIRFHNSFQMRRLVGTWISDQARLLAHRVLIQKTSFRLKGVLVQILRNCELASVFWIYSRIRIFNIWSLFWRFVVHLSFESINGDFEFGRWW